ncbi:MAG: hypothetical protein A2Z20_11365 [Bdellovibrionales bacterium RBG_16_40_8]|nr:MAG: hypothetical protein A2Z20_11365 [Bdellovibrionales bacterium RBG_16_40_8]
MPQYKQHRGKITTYFYRDQPVGRAPLNYFRFDRELGPFILPVDSDFVQPVLTLAELTSYCKNG